MADIPHFKLNTGATIPSVGLGCWQGKAGDNSSDPELVDAIKMAIDTAGYRAKKVDFEAVLTGALKGESPGLRASNPFGAGSGIGDAANGALTNSFTVGRGGSVDRRAEVSAMTLDNVKFRVITQQVTNSLSSIRSVIAEMGRG